MLTEELSAIQARLAAATPGPWIYQSFGSGSKNVSPINTNDFHFGSPRPPKDGILRHWSEARNKLCDCHPETALHWVPSDHDEQETANLEFIAHAWEDIRALLFEVECSGYLDPKYDITKIKEFYGSRSDHLVEPEPGEHVSAWVVNELTALHDENARLKSRVDPAEESKRITALSDALQENERLRGLVRRAFNEGFNYGVRLRMENDGNAVIFDTKIKEAWEQSDVRVMTKQERVK